MQTLIRELRENGRKAPLWSRIADDLERPTRQRREVNLSSIGRNTNANEVVIVPGKVLGSGALPHAVTVAAWSFSEGARKRIADAKGKCLSINELLKSHPDGKNVRILG